MEFTSSIHNKTGGKRICSRFRRISAHVEQERPELSRLPNCKGLQKSDDGCYSQGRNAKKEEATVYVKQLDLFLTIKLLEDAPAVLPLGKLCEDHGYSYHWTRGQKPQLIKNDRRIKCNTANHVPIVVPGLSTGSSSSATPTSRTSLPQEAVIPTRHPASTRSENTVPPENISELIHGPKKNEFESCKQMKKRPLSEFLQKNGGIIRPTGIFFFRNILG